MKLPGTARPSSVPAHAAHAAHPARRGLPAWIACLFALALPSASPAAAADSVRVGLVTGAAWVRVDAPGSELMLSVDADAPARRRAGPLLFGRREGQPAARAQWEVRAGLEPTRRRAEAVRTALGEALGLPLRVEKAGAMHAVLAGPFDDERRARAVLDELAAVGIDDAALLPLRSGEDGAPLVVLTGSWDVLPATRASVSTADGSPIQVDGKPHRGSVEILAGEGGLLTAVVVIDRENYLRGVVPGEMGPDAYPAIEALKAQAVAARTYALMPPAHASDGFERCSGPHCQVYGGVAVEHPLSDRAVAETASWILVHDGRPIDAYYSSTCGGHTEDVTNVFAAEARPYLRGVPCYPEKVEFLRIPGRQLAVDFNRIDGRTAHGVLARLIAAGVVTDDEARAGVFSRRARGDESATWLRRAAAVASRTLDGPPSSLNVDTALGFLRGVLQATGASSQQRLLAAQDMAAAARFRELQGLAGDDLSTGLLALKSGLLPEGLEPGWGQSKLSRGNVLELIEGWLRAQGALAPAPVRFVSARDGALHVLSGTEVKAVGVAPGLLLLSGRSGAPQRMRESLELKLGDRLRIHRDASDLAACIELDEDPDGASLDRLSAYSWWSRRVPFTKLADAAAALGFGDLRDVRVGRISDAGRVVGLQLVDGAEATRDLSGFAVRQFLGLPDSRCELRMERDRSGRLEAVTATGRGWGHGVGLCQIGAFGQALMGRRSEEILAHYYPGTRLEGRRER